MSQIEAVFFDCDGTLVDSEVICSRAYVTMFQEFGITLDPEEVFKRFKGVKLYEISYTLNETTSVTFYYDRATHRVWNTATDQTVTLPGTFQKSLGCSIQNWKPSKGLERSCQRSLRQCVWYLTAQITKCSILWAS